MAFTSESVTEGHPDKLADQISDAILDAYLAKDPAARVAVETMVTGNHVILGGEVTSRATIDKEAVARATIARVGYTSEALGMDASTAAVQDLTRGQSPDIARGVDGAVQGAGDQGLMFGYACHDTPALYPLAPWLAHTLARRLAAVRREVFPDLLGPDGKTQVTIGQDRSCRTLDTVLVSTQHAPDVTAAGLREVVQELVLQPVVARLKAEVPGIKTNAVKLLVNPTGRFVVGGPEGDAGLTGRKIIVDTYGGVAHHGGGAFSGKDPSKVDRSAAYAMRWVAKNVVASGLAKRCEVQVAYAIGVAEPVSLRVSTFGTGTISDAKITARVRSTFDLTPAGITAALGLTDARRVRYEPTAAYGHFGRDDLGLPWEDTSTAARLAA